MAYTQACKRADSLLHELAATLTVPGDSAPAGEQTGATATASACVAAPKNTRRRLQQRATGEPETSLPPIYTVQSNCASETFCASALYKSIVYCIVLYIDESLS